MTTSSDLFNISCPDSIYRIDVIDGNVVAVYTNGSSQLIGNILNSINGNVIFSNVQGNIDLISGNGAINIGNDCGTVLVPSCADGGGVVVDPGNGNVIIGNIDSPNNPSITVPSNPNGNIALDPGADGNVVIGNPDGPSITVPGDPSGNLTLDPGADGNVVIGNPDNPGITVPSDGSGPIIGDPENPLVGVDANGNPFFAITILDEGNVVSNIVSSINFVGNGVGATADGDTGNITVTVNGLTVNDEGNLIANGVTVLNFVGALVDARNGQNEVNVYIPSLNGNIASPGNTTEIIYNLNGNLHAEANLRYINGGLFAGQVNNQTLIQIQSGFDANGVITAQREYRVGTWSNLFDQATDSWARFRITNAGPAINTSPFYGFNERDPALAGNVSVTAITSEEQDYNQAFTMWDNTEHNESFSDTDAIAFGFSTYPNGTASATTGWEPEWVPQFGISRFGNAITGGNVVINLNWRNQQVGNANVLSTNDVGIIFADNTFQWTAAYNSQITIIDEVSGNILTSNANTITFVGTGVTATLDPLTENNITVTINGLTVQDEGSTLSTNVDTINFVGTGVTTSGSGNVATVTLRDTVTDLGSISGSVTPNAATASVQKATLTGAITLQPATNMNVGQSLTLILTQGGSGSYALTADSAYKFASNYRTLSTSVGSIDMLNMFYDGSVYYVTLTTGYV